MSSVLAVLILADAVLLGTTDPEAGSVRLRPRLDPPGFVVGQPFQAPPARAGPVEARAVASLDIVPDSPMAPHLSETSDLLLAVRLNGSEVDELVTARLRGPDILVTSDSMSRIGVAVKSAEIGQDGFVSLASLSDVVFKYGDAEQTLDLQVAPLRLKNQIVDFENFRTSRAAARSATGLGLQYDISTSHARSSAGDSSLTTDGTVTSVLFSPLGVLSNTAILHIDARTDYVRRLETSFEITQPQSLQRLTIGDSLSGSLNWSRSLRFGGIQLASDFSLRPELTTFPLPTFFGQSAVPSAVDVLVNSSRVYEGLVEPGPFELRNIPVFVGQGDVRVTLRDLTGRTVVQSVPFFAGSQLLRKDMSSYSMEIGFEREGYGISSYTYGDAFASASLRRGLTDQLTGELHAEVSGDILMAGAGLVRSVGHRGQLYGSLALSDWDAGTGQQVTLGGQFYFGKVSLFGEAAQTFGDFLDVASLNSPLVAEQNLRLGVTFAPSNRWSVTAGWLERRTADDEGNSRVFTASMSVSAFRNWNFGSSMLYDAASGDSSAGVYLHLPLGPEHWSSASLDQSSSGARARYTYGKSTGSDDKLGYSMSLSQGDAPILNGSVQWTGDASLLRGDLQTDPDGMSLRVGASGAFILLKGRVYPAARADGSFVLVETGRPGVDVFRENRRVGRTDRDGRLMVGGLVPFSSNHIEVDQSEFPLSTSLNEPGQVVVPPRRSAVVADFRPRSESGTLLEVRLPLGVEVPRGAIGRIIGGSEDDLIPVGTSGRVFLANLTQPIEVRFSWATGTCKATLKPGSKTDDSNMIDGGIVYCQPEGPAGAP